MSFWAVEITPVKSYKSTPPYDLHVTQAVLPAAASDAGRTVVQTKIEDKMFSIASLKLGSTDQTHLDLVFEEGEEVEFTVTGKNSVHLAGYYMVPGDDSEIDFGDSDEEGAGFGEGDEEIGSDDELNEEESESFRPAQAGQKRKGGEHHANGHDAKKPKQDAAPAHPEPHAQAPAQPQQRQQGEGRKKKEKKNKQQHQEGETQGEKPQHAKQHQAKESGQHQAKDHQAKDHPAKESGQHQAKDHQAKESGHHQAKQNTPKQAGQPAAQHTPKQGGQQTPKGSGKKH